MEDVAEAVVLTYGLLIGFALGALAQLQIGTLVARISRLLFTL